MEKKNATIEETFCYALSIMGLIASARPGSDAESKAFSENVAVAAQAAYDILTGIQGELFP